MVNPNILVTQRSPSDFNPADRIPKDFEYPKQALIEKLWVRFGIVAFALDDKILMVDLSHWNGTVDWNLLRQSGVVAVILKCSEGAEGTYYEYKDTKFETFWRQALDANFTVMIYHFFRGEKGSAEFNWFMKCADAYLNDPRVLGHTAAWLDCEVLPSGMSRTTYTNRAFGFCDMASGTGFRPGIYSSPGLVPTLFDPAVARWNTVWQWNAHWTSAVSDTLPIGWTEALRVIWQRGIYPTHSWIPIVKGAGTVDVNYGFWSSVDALRRWLGFGVSSPSPSPSPSPSSSPSASPSSSPDCCEDHELRIRTIEAGMQLLTDIQNTQAEQLNTLATQIATNRQAIKTLDENVSTMGNSLQSLSERVDSLSISVGKIDDIERRVEVLEGIIKSLKDCLCNG